MSKELDSVRAEAFKKDPDWKTVAQRIAEQPGCEAFPVETVAKILNRPGELLVTTLGAREGFFAIGAMITSRNRPFTIVSDSDNRITALKIYPETKPYASGRLMYADRDIAFSTEVGPTWGFSNWMGAGISDTAAVTLSASNPDPDLSIGIDKVNTFFEELVHTDKFNSIKDRLVGCLFQVARLALDFDAQTPVAPEELEDEVSRAKLYYAAAQDRARAIINARTALAILHDKIADRKAIPTPAIHFERPLDLPSVEDVIMAEKKLSYSPNDPELGYFLQAYREALETLDLLKPN